MRLDTDAMMVTEPSQLFTDLAYVQEPARSITPPPSEPAQLTPTRDQENTIAQFLEHIKPANRVVEITDHYPATRSDRDSKDAMVELAPSPVLENGYISTTPTEKLPPKHPDFSKR
jgi:hypothetical protein